MAHMSSGVSLSVPPTQNTAEVREFRCMFTHDLRRKAKRWQDGFLSYHLFNNRIIVYDESKNRIGDAYWRKDFDFGEGEELQLQQGVLIDVQDQLGTKEQDVTGVIASRDTGKATSAQSAKISPWKNVTTIGQSGSSPQTNAVAAAPGVGWRPKSLKEIFKTPIGTFGRARMPESPYEQRKAASPTIPAGREPVVMCRQEPKPITNNNDNSRPRKRHRIDEGSEEPKTPKRAISAAHPAKKGRTQTAKTNPPAPVAHTASPILIESDEESVEFTPMRPLPPPREASKRPTTRESRPSVSSLTTKSAAPEPPSKTAAKNGKMAKRTRDEWDDTVATAPTESRPPTKRARKGTEMTKATTEDNNVDEDIRKQREHSVSIATRGEDSRRSNVLRERPVNILKSAASQPRRKLLYRELLPADFVSKRSKSQGTASSFGRVRSTTPKVSNVSNVESSKDTPIRRQSCERPDSRRESAMSLTESVMEIDAPDGTARGLSAPPQREATPEIADDHVDDALFDESMLDDDDFLMEEDAPTLAELDQALIESDRQRALSAAVNRAMGAMRPPPTTGPSLASVIANVQKQRKSPKRGPLQRVQTEPALDSPAAQRRRSPLKKTTSDTTGRNDQPPEPVVVNNDKGPWSREAFDLFGWSFGESKEIRTSVLT